LRDERRAGSVDEVAPAIVLAASDPAQPYGASLPWPDVDGRPSRAVGAYVVSRDGHVLAFLERGGRSLVVFPGGEGDADWVPTLASLVHNKQLKKIEIQKINGVPPAEQPELRDLLTSNGFSQGYKGPTLR